MIILNKILTLFTRLVDSFFFLVFLLDAGNQTPDWAPAKQAQQQGVKAPKLPNNNGKKLITQTNALRHVQATNSVMKATKATETTTITIAVGVKCKLHHIRDIFMARYNSCHSLIYMWVDYNYGLITL